MGTPNTDAEDRRLRVEQLETILVAQDNIVELVRIAAEASDSTDLVESIAAALSISEGYAHMVRLTSLERLATRYGRERIIEELDQLRDGRR